MGLRYLQQRHAGRFAVTGRSGTAGIDKKDALFGFHSRAVRVAVDDRHTGALKRMHIQTTDIVNQVNQPVSGLDGFLLLELFDPRTCIHIAPHRDHRSDRLKGGQYRRRADVAGMQNQVDLPENRQGVFRQITVGVGNDSESIAGLVGQHHRHHHAMFSGPALVLSGVTTGAQISRHPPSVSSVPACRRVLFAKRPAESRPGSLPAASSFHVETHPLGISRPTSRYG